MPLKNVIVDTSFFIALLDKSDSLHKLAIKASAKYSTYEWITTWPVLSELSYLLKRDVMQKIFELRNQGLFSLFPIEDDFIIRLQELFLKYPKIDFADLSLIILAENLDHGQILTGDQKDFSFLKWKTHKPFINLLVL